MYRDFKHIDDGRLQRWIFTAATALSLAVGTAWVLVVQFHG